MWQLLGRWLHHSPAPAGCSHRGIPSPRFEHFLTSAHFALQSRLVTYLAWYMTRANRASVHIKFVSVAALQIARQFRTKSWSCKKSVRKWRKRKGRIFLYAVRLSFSRQSSCAEWLQGFAVARSQPKTKLALGVHNSDCCPSLLTCFPGQLFLETEVSHTWSDLFRMA